MENNQIEKRKKNRSAAYPGVNLQNSLQNLKKLHIKLGGGPYDRLSAAKELGYSSVSGVSATKIAALVHYGLLQRKGAGYMETDLGKLLANPIDDEEQEIYLRSALMSPVLFKQLYDDYKDKILPERLDVILSRNYKITEQVSDDVANIFRESAEYAGILRNGQLLDEDEVKTEFLAGINNEEVTGKKSVTKDYSSAGEMNHEGYNIVEVGSGVKVIFPQRFMLRLAMGDFSEVTSKLKEIISSIEEDSIPNRVGGYDKEEDIKK